MTGWSRRTFLGAATLAALHGAAASGAALLAQLDPGDAPSLRQRKLMRDVAECVIPTGDTPGAGAIGVNNFVFVALAHGLEGTRRPPAPEVAADPAIAPHLRADGSLDHAAWLEARLGSRWLALPPAGRLDQLAALDAAAYARGDGAVPAAAPWRAIKGLILTGYYTSEIGGSRELSYELVPGRFDPKVPVTPETRAWSSDWTAVDFG